MWGISGKSPNDCLVFSKKHSPDIVQANLNLLDQRAVENNLINFCSSEGIGFVGRTPFGFGFLTGLVNEDSKIS